jgi:hypothetical protein
MKVTPFLSNGIDRLSFSRSMQPSPRAGTGLGVIQFIGSADTQKIPLNQLRPCQSSQTDPSAQYADREHVEVSARPRPGVKRVK